VPHLRSILAPRALVFLAAVVASGLALGYRLGAWDVENDEAIYTYAVERMLDTGDWLTPRSIPTDAAFLEKPPLKFWLIAAPMRLGLLPRTPAGFRAIDLLLAAIAFGYVALIGYRLAGTACAIAACLLLFGMRDLVLSHGLRTNNMEASLFAAYCGGLYHFHRWREDGRRGDALATGGWFTLAFLTKFVAAAFLPLVAVLAFLVPQPRTAPKPWRAWIADWAWTAALVVACSAPWFIYQYLHVGHELIETMFLQHVFARFTGALDPEHLHPWDYYLRQIERTLRDARCLWLVALGAGLLAWRAAWRRDALAWTTILWGVVPLAIISTFTSKLYHYAYPFLPPLAIAAGVALAAPISFLKPSLERLAARLEALPLRVPARLSGTAARRTLLVIGTVAIVLAGFAVLVGTAKVVVGGLVLRNTSIVRPLVVAAVAFSLARAWRHALTIGPVALMMLLPIGAARETLRYTAWEGHPLRTMRDCARPLVAAGRVRGGALGVSTDPLPHTYAYYFLALGPWDNPSPPDIPAVSRLIDDPHARLPVVMSNRAFSALALQRVEANLPIPPAVASPPGYILLLPGPLGSCVDAAVRAGGRSVGGPSEGAS
jgi:4-amino-4-deoxy-L-arabinose transferase-like glycosyltransferase